jgi:hypothetical protein
LVVDRERRLRSTHIALIGKPAIRDLVEDIVIDDG